MQHHDRHTHHDWNHAHFHPGWNHHGWLHGGWGATAGWHGWTGWNWPSYTWNRSYYNYGPSHRSTVYRPSWSSAGAGRYFFNTGNTGGVRYVWPNPYYLYYNPKVYNYAPTPPSYVLYRGPGITEYTQNYVNLAPVASTPATTSSSQ